MGEMDHVGRGLAPAVSADKQQSATAGDSRKPYEKENNFQFSIFNSQFSTLRRGLPEIVDCNFPDFPVK